MTRELMGGRYRLGEEMGRGSMGIVHRARDTRLERDVAVKVLSPELLDATGRRRLAREARVVARLGHPNIVGLHDAGECEGSPFLVMELVEGESLRGAAPLPAADVVEIAIQLCRALAHAHARGVVHRDVKPENVLVPRAERGGVRVKLMDFGLSSAQGASRLTRQGTVLGTLAYIAPEQALDEAVDGRADLYSLGVVLYELCAGRPPFSGGRPQVILSQHIKAEPPPPSRYASGIPPDLERLILRLLAKRPADRFASAEQTLEALEALAVPAADAPAIRAARADLANAPERRTEIIGRSREVAAGLALLARPDARLVTLTGPGGTGKTRLALEMAAEAAPQFEHGAWFVPLADLADPAHLVPEIARVVGAETQPGRAAEEALAEWLAERSVLLVLDNFEQLVAAADRVARLLDAAPRLRVLATSRERLGIAGERELEVPPLELPAEDETAGAESWFACAAVELFVRRARAHDPCFELTDANARAIGDLCARLDGLPLAIELAAARVRLLSPEAMSRELAERPAGAALSLLGHGAEGAPERQRTLRGAIRWSWGRLDAAERAVFETLAVFEGSFSLEAAREVCARLSLAAAPEGGDAALDALSGLVAKSLVRREPPASAAGEARFRMLETLREFAAEQLRAAGAEERTRDAHAGWFAAHAARSEAALRGERQTAALDSLERDLPNLRAALRRLLDLGDAMGALALLVALRWFWMMRGYSSEARVWFAAALSRHDGTPSALLA